ncbi:MAG: PAS domain S-box protein, partial [Cyanobacteria bacterium P01_F01_bin.86]
RFGEAQLYQQMKVAANVAFVYCGSSRRGEFFGVVRSPQDGALRLSYSNASNEFVRDVFSLDVSGVRTFKHSQAESPYDARQRPWYRAATAAQGPAWTDVYMSFTLQLPNVTASLPVYDRSGQRLLGVCATDVVLPEEFRDFLRALKIGDNGQAFVIDREGNLIANSSDEPLMVGEGDQARSLQVLESQDILVQGAAEYIQANFGGFDQIRQPQRLDFQLDGQRQFLEVMPFRDGFGLDWLIVVVVPEHDFMWQIRANTRTTILLALGGIAIAILIAVLAARLLTRPVSEVCQAAAGIAKGNLTQRIATSPIREMQQLAQTFNSMAMQLQSSFKALRQSEAKSRAIVEAMPDLLMRTRRDGTYAEIIGRDRLLRTQKNHTFISEARVGEALPPELARQRLECIDKALATGHLQVYEQCLKFDGLIYHEEVRITVLDDDEVLIIVRDITQQKQAEAALRIAEENYRSIYENALEGIFRSSQAGQLLSVNRAMAKLYGYDSPAAMVEQITDAAQQLYVDAKDRQRFIRLMAEQGTVKNFEYRSYRRDGQIIWVEENTRAVRDDTGTVIYFEGMVQDISDRKAREAKLHRLFEELQIEIDDSKVTQEVIQITESDFFQELQSTMSQINRAD